MPLSKLLYALVPFAGICSISLPAFGAPDPFETETIAPPRPVLYNTANDTELPCQAPPANALYSATEVVDFALCRNPQTREAWANARYQAAQVGLAQSSFLPNLDGKMETNRGRTNAENVTQHNASLTLSWLLYDFGARTANLENTRQLLSAAASTLDATVQTVFLSALQSYYNAQAARAALVATEESEKASRESLAAAEVRYKVGVGTPADRLQAQTAWSQATLNRIKAEGTLKNAFGTLANIMGLDANRSLRLAEIPDAMPDEAFERDMNALIEQARQSRPDLKAAEAQFKAAQSTIDLARSSGLPKLTLGAGPTWQQQSNNEGNIGSHSNSVGLTLTLPIFTGFDTTYKIRSAQIKAEIASVQRDSLRLQIALEVWTAYQNLLTATQTIRTSADLLTSAEQSERVALGRYKAGVGTILDLLNAQSALASARVQRIQAMLDWNIARATLAKAVGVLDRRLLTPAAAGPTP